MTEKELEAIEARLEAATPGPWKMDGCEYVNDSEGRLICEIDGENCGNGRFITECRTDLADLCAALREAWMDRDHALAIAKDNRERRIKAEDAQMALESEVDDLYAIIAMEDDAE